MHSEPYIKYGRTFHLPHSPGLQSDDKAWKTYEPFLGERVIATKKMDGECTAGYSDGYVHARSIDGRGGEDRAWVKKFLAENVCPTLPQGWRVYGENLWAKHSIAYDDLPSFFMGFSIWDDNNVCLSWDKTVERFNHVGVTHVPVLADEIFSEEMLKRIEASLDWERDEGYVVRLAKGFAFDDFGKSIAKYVRSGHVQTTQHWRQTAFVPNKLAP